jgi:hypothetical protein
MVGVLGAEVRCGGAQQKGDWHTCSSRKAGVVLDLNVCKEGGNGAMHVTPAKAGLTRMTPLIAVARRAQQVALTALCQALHLRPSRTSWLASACRTKVATKASTQKHVFFMACQ